MSKYQAKVGDIRYYCFCSFEGVNLYEMHCTTVNKNGSYWWHKDSASWSKRSTKRGDYGWNQMYASTHRYHVGPDESAYSKTKGGAVRTALAVVRARTSVYKKFYSEGTQERYIAMLKRRYAKIKHPQRGRP